MMKFIARNRVAVAAGVIVVISLVATTIVSLWQADQARVERDRTYEINQFLQTILTETDPYEAGADATIRDVLRKAGGLIDERFVNQPDIEAPLRYTIGYIPCLDGNTEEAMQMLTNSLTLMEQISAPGWLKDQTNGWLNEVSRGL